MYGNFCVACFSGTYKNEPMWSHYVNCENGICLRFKIKNYHNKPYIKTYSPTGVYCDNKTKFSSCLDGYKNMDE